MNATSHPKVALYLHPSWAGGRDQIIKDAVGHRLVEGSFVPETPKVELEALELDAGFRRAIADLDGCEVRLASFGAQAGELRTIELDLESALGLGIGEGL